ncbi:hypothetical protein COB55_02165 [Candidatus Wolfebacteria bacterium]|nr:MAG: hypothetical protein COB55_02165 [Candidatus Wolfebacteria bacterium]
MNYLVKTDAFEGPLELLLSLIEKRKLFINDISLATVTDDYITYVNERGNFPTSEIANFIVVAATLLLIKSKSLLPSMILSEDEESDIADLEHRLKVYQRMQELSVHVRERFGKNTLFSRSRVIKREAIFAPSRDTDMEKIVPAIKSLLQNLPKKISIPQTIVQKVISIEEMIDNLTERVTSNLRMSFKDFAGTQKEKVDVIVGFLAMLELVKQGVITVEQQANFDEIQMESKQVATPSYI